MYEEPTERELESFVNSHVSSNETMLVNDLLKKEIYHWEDLENLSAEDKEIYEWWSCNDWFIEKLLARGEPILRTDYKDYWGRTCTGQAISMDTVIKDIYKSL